MDSLIHQNAKLYKSTYTDHENKFNNFIKWAKNGNHDDTSNNNYVIQFVKHPNFQPNNKEIKYFMKQEDQFIICDNISDYKKANSYKNLKTSSGEGHSKGLFYELNLYLNDDSKSNHHTSTTSGLSYDRDNSHDGNIIQTKGQHWKY